MTAYVQIAVNVPSVAGVFDYALPADLAGKLEIGHLMVVPFGAQKVQGVLLRFLDQPSVEKTKQVLELVDPEPVLTPAQIALAQSMAQDNLAPLAAMIALHLPPGLSQQADTLYSLSSENPTAEIGQTGKRLIALLKKRGPLRGRQIETHFRRVDWRKSANWLIRHGLLSKQSVLPAPRVRPKSVRVAQLAVPLDEAEAALSNLGTTAATQKRRAAALRFLMQEPDEINVSWVYAQSGSNLTDLRELAARDLILLRETEIWRDPLSQVEGQPQEPVRELRLTPAQQTSWEAIQSGFQQLAAGQATKPYLLHGVTGSGKTELYLRAAQEIVRKGKQAIILVPEIALTPQTVRRFLSRFPGQVGLLHSKLSEGERYDTWRRARSGAIKVMIGPRSALFAPLQDIGLIVLDECHDSSYYQSEPPFYHAVSAAVTYASQCGALCILGSATPTVVQSQEAEAGKSIRLDLPERIPEAGSSQFAAGLPPVSIVDMREELKAGNRDIFSRPLTKALNQTLARSEQAILFLNRRGTATYVFCRSCGFALKCPQCETPFTFHVHKHERLLCHHCGYTRRKPTTCPECKSTQIREYGLGSERVEAEVGRLFPKARVLRWDWETTRQKDAHEVILSHFAAQRADVLVGTQMLAKGLDFPLVTLVGIVLADVGLNLPDPFATERVFQVLTQVAGRAGRSPRGGQVFLQTFEPDHQIIRAAALHDYNGFYEHELAGRKKLGYPPFGRLVRLEFRHRDAGRVEAEARRLAETLKTSIQVQARSQTDIIGPVPCFYARLRGETRWHILLRGPNLIDVLKGQRFEGWRIEVDPISLL